MQASARHFHRSIARALLLGTMLAVPASAAMARETETDAGSLQEPGTPADGDLVPAPAQVDVKPTSRDEDIRERLQSVLGATNWFPDAQVRVEEGVVFLTGRAESDELKRWAGDLARSTQDVVAVANQMEVPEPSTWDLSPAWAGLSALRREFVQSLPFLVFGLVVLMLSAGLGVLAARLARAFLRERIQAQLLRTVMARALGALVFLFGVYVVLRVSGLTQLALTVVGGTGLIGLAVGIAFRDITENFLASIFLSMQRPFRKGDLVEVSGVTGYVQQLNMRTSILMTLDGNLVQIPNSIVYKSNLRNFTTNCNRRDDFVVGIGYDDSIDEAQEIARKVLMDHPAVLNDPEPSVLADSLGKATVNLRVYFWLDGREHSWLKVRSSVIRLVKRAFQEHGVSMPDEAREVVFPQSVPVTLLEAKPGTTQGAARSAQLPAEPTRGSADIASTRAEAGLYSDAVVIEEQARQVRPLSEGDDLLDVAGTSSSDEQAREPGEVREEG